MPVEPANRNELGVAIRRDLELFDGLGRSPLATFLNGDPDPRLWGRWEWSSLSLDTLSAIEHFERQLRPAPTYSWREDALIPRLVAGGVHRSGLAAQLRALLRSAAALPT